jgi:hypothetical protein
VPCADITVAHSPVRWSSRSSRPSASSWASTPGGLGVIEVTLVAITVGFGAPRPTAVLAVLGYRIVNYWLPLLPGAVAYLRLRLRPGADDKRKGKGKPATARPG